MGLGLVVAIIAAGAYLAVEPRLGSGDGKPLSAGGEGVAVAAGTTTTTTAASTATFPGPNGPEATWVVKENLRPGTTGWQITGDQSGGIMGYADQVQVTQGQTVRLFVSSQAPTF